MIRSRLCAISVVLLFVGFLRADGLPTVRPEEVGLSAERLARITATMEKDVAEGRIPGALALIARHGKIAYLEARGMADRETRRPIRPDTIFRIYSMSKPITGVALMMLFEEGRFRLDDPVSKYIPELGGLQVLVENPADAAHAGHHHAPSQPAAGKQDQPEGNGYKLVKADRDMTIQDLLRHTSGLSYGFSAGSQADEQYKKADVLSMDQDLALMAQKLGKLPLRHQPGSTWEYSISVDVQGRLIEVLSGMRFDEFLQKRVFEPLGMADTSFLVPDNKKDRFAQLYAPDGNGGVKPADPKVSERYTPKNRFLSGGGGMISTLGDYLRFCQMMLNGGELDGKRLLSPKTVQLMTIDHLGDVKNGRGKIGYGFGLGFAVATDLSQSGLPGSLGEYNWGGAAGTKFWIDPKENLIGIYMVQILPHTGLRFGEMFKILAYQSIVE